MIPSVMPAATEPKAHHPMVDNETGIEPSMSLPSTPIQKHPTPPTIAPRTLSLRVTGACHQSIKCCRLRLKNAEIIKAPNAPVNWQQRAQHVDVQLNAELG